MILEAAMGAEPAAVKTQSLTVVDLLDECWFFKSVWITRETPTSDDDNCVKGESEGADGGCGSQDRAVSSACKTRTPALHRMPTLPPRLRCMDAVQEEPASSLNACNPKLRHSLSSLDNYRSSSSSSSKNSLSSPSMARDRPPRYIKLERSERYLAIQHYIAKEAYYTKRFKEKKWRSHSDLEYIEVQGFKDLGFVFDKKDLNANLTKVLPGLANMKTSSGERIAGPYLSESRVVQKSAPPMFRCVDKRSTEDMKEQLMFWARAVACNARKES